MPNIFTGPRPDITPAQIVSGIPILAEFLHSFGFYTLSKGQQDSLSMAATWAFALIAGDTVLRVGRNLSGARVQAAGIVAGTSGGPPVGQSPPAGATDAGSTDDASPQTADLPTDAEEFAAPPPGPPPVQPSQVSLQAAAGQEGLSSTGSAGAT